MNSKRKYANGYACCKMNAVCVLFLCIASSLLLFLCMFIYVVVCVNIRVYGPAICLICTANEFICIIVMQIEDDFCCFLIRLISICPFVSCAMQRNTSSIFVLLPM